MKKKTTAPDKFRGVQKVSFGIGAVRLPDSQIHDLAAEPPEMDRVLKFDPLETAHNMLKSGNVPEDTSASALGFWLLQENSRHRDELLRQQGDTVRNDKPERFLKITENLGFECVMHLPIKHDDRDDDFYVYARRDGLILIMSTYTITETHVNTAYLHYQWKRNDPSLWDLSLMGSGGFHVREGQDLMTADESELIWHGTMPVDEAFARKLGLLEKHGRFLPEWIHNSEVLHTNVNLAHYGDRKNGELSMRSENMEDISEDRKTELPDWVRSIIGKPVLMSEYVAEMSKKSERKQ